jgi:hypothetical protein
MIELAVTLGSHGYMPAWFVCEVTIPGFMGSQKSLFGKSVISHLLLRPLLLTQIFSPLKCSVNLDFVQNLQVHS